MLINLILLLLMLFSLILWIVLLVIWMPCLTEGEVMGHLRVEENPLAEVTFHVAIGTGSEAVLDELLQGQRGAAEAGERRVDELAVLALLLGGNHAEALGTVVGFLREELRTVLTMRVGGGLLAGHLLLAHCADERAGAHQLVSCQQSLGNQHATVLTGSLPWL